MIPLLMKVLSTVIGLIEEHPEIAKGLLSRALELLHYSENPGAGSTGANILRNQLAAQAGVQAGLAAAVASALTSAREHERQVEADAVRSLEVERERQHDIDHGVGIEDTPIPYTLPGQSP